MISITLAQLAEYTKGRLLDAQTSTATICGVSIDTRTTQPGQLFVPLLGAQADGHRFLQNAEAAGAGAALWQEDHPVPEHRIPLLLVPDTLQALWDLAAAYRNQVNPKVIAITGSNGKTTVKDLTASLLATRYRTHKTPGNYNSLTGLPLTILGMDEDTQALVLEMGMESLGEIRTLSRIATPDAAIITNIGEAHLEALGSRQNIARAKLEILEGLKPHGLLIYSGDEPLLKNSIKAGPSERFRCITFGASPYNDCIPHLQSMSLHGLSMELDGRTYELPLLGSCQIYNAAAAILCARAFHVADEQMNEGFARLQKTGMRSELLDLGKYTIINDCYKSNPSSLWEAIKLFYSFQGYQRKIAVLGDMNGLGESGPMFHKRAGGWLHPDKVDYVLTFGELSRLMAQAANFPEGRILSFTDFSALVEALTPLLIPGTLLLVKGSRENALERLIRHLQAPDIFLQRESRVEIDLDAIVDNTRQIRRFLPSHTKLFVAVKADAYGHGDLPVSQAVLEGGADGLVVSILQEALYLRRGGINAPILILSPILPQDAPLAARQDFCVTVFQTDWLKKAAALWPADLRAPLKLHIKIDTGLGRLGVRSCEELASVTDTIQSLSGQGIPFEIDGCYTHFATANHSDPTYYRRQMRQFDEMRAYLRDAGISIANYHCANSAAALQYPETRLDMVRMGVAVFGIYPSPQIKASCPLHLKTALSVHTRLLSVKKVEKGNCVGYDNGFVAEEDSWVGILPMGYADGYFRIFQGFHVLVDGQYAPIIGKICMDQTMVLLPRRYEPGTEVVILGEQGGNAVTLEDMADYIGSVPQEIPSMFTYRLPRIYYRNGAPVQVIDHRLWPAEPILEAKEIS